jgi:WD40 repeat protein
LDTLLGHTAAPTALAFSADGARLLTASGDATARVWKLSASPSRSASAGGTFQPRFAGDGQSIIIPSDNAALILDASTLKERATLAGHTGTIDSAVLSADGAVALTGSSDGSARLWDSSGVTKHVLQGHTGAINHVLLSPDERLAITIGKDKKAVIWDVGSGGMIKTFDHAHDVKMAAFSASGKFLVTVDNAARVWDTSNWTSRAVLGEVEPRPVPVLDGNTTILGTPGSPERAAFSSDGSILVTTDSDAVRVWQLADQQEVWSVPSSGSPIPWVSSDATFAMTRSANGEAQLWHIPTRRLVSAFPNLETMDVLLTPDGRLVVSHDDDTVRIWDTAAARQMLTFHMSSNVSSAGLSPDGGSILARGSNGALRLWTIPDLLKVDRSVAIETSCKRLSNARLNVLLKDELAELPFLDPVLDRDPCDPPSFLMRTAYALGVESWTTGYYKYDPRAAEHATPAN